MTQVKKKKAQPAKRAKPAPAEIKRPPIGKNIPAAPPPGYGMERPTSWISPGRYRMRNKSIAVVTDICTIRFGVNMSGIWHGWKGHLENHPDGEGLSWNCEGKRSDAAPAHEHDLISREKGKAKR